MALLFCLSWWYSHGWGFALRQVNREISGIGDTFAVHILLKTLFSPWKQISSVSGTQTFFQRLIDNTISRTIGLVIRSFILLIASIWTVLTLFFGILFIVLWPAIPLLVLVFPVLYFYGVTF